MAFRVVDEFVDFHARVVGDVERGAVGKGDTDLPVGAGLNQVAAINQIAGLGLIATARGRFHLHDDACGVFDTRGALCAHHLAVVLASSVAGCGDDELVCAELKPTGAPPRRRSRPTKWPSELGSWLFSTQKSPRPVTDNAFTLSGQCAPIAVPRALTPQALAGFAQFGTNSRRKGRSATTRKVSGPG